MDKIFGNLFPNFKSAIEHYLANHHASYLKGYIEAIYWIIVLISIYIIKRLYLTLANLIKNYRINKNSSDLLEYYSSKEIRDATKYFLTTHGQSNDPSQFLEPKDSLNKAVDKKNLIKYFRTEFSSKYSEKKFFLIIGDSGMGKTTFLLNLYLKFKSSFLPYKKRTLFLISLSNAGYRKKIADLLKNNKDAILLLDAFDEDVTSWQQPEKGLKQLLKDVSGFSMVVLSSRGHFFSSKIDGISQVDIFSNIANKERFKLTKIYLSPINDVSIYLYLLKKYLLRAPFKIYKSYNIVKQCPNLMVRPMLLNNVDYLLKSQKKYAFTAEIYIRLILSWINREQQYIDEWSVMSFSKDISKYMYDYRNSHKGLYIYENELSIFLKMSNIDIETVVMKTRSLLNRTSDKYKFSHKSIFEFFLALSKFDGIELEFLPNMALNNPFSLEGLSDAERFFNELYLIKITIPYLERYTSYSIDPYTLRNTKTLNIEGSKIMNILFLKEMFWLESLNLSHTLVRDLKPLYSLRHLKKVDLRGTYYDRVGNYPGDPTKQVEELQNALPSLKITF